MVKQEMVEDWGREEVGENITRRGEVLESHSLTQTDREYFNIIKTEDGLSEFVVESTSDKVFGKKEKKAEDTEGTDSLKSEHSIPHFKFNLVHLPDKSGIMMKKSIVGLYLVDD